MIIKTTCRFCGQEIYPCGERPWFSLPEVVFRYYDCPYCGAKDLHISRRGTT